MAGTCWNQMEELRDIANLSPVITWPRRRFDSWDDDDRNRDGEEHLVV